MVDGGAAGWGSRAPSNPAQRLPARPGAPGTWTRLPAHSVTPHPEPPSPAPHLPAPPISAPPGLPARTATLQLARPRLTGPSGPAAGPASPRAGRRAPPLRPARRRLRLAAGFSVSPPQPQRLPVALPSAGAATATAPSCSAHARPAPRPRPTQTAGAFRGECRPNVGPLGRGGAWVWVSGDYRGGKGLSPKGAAEEQTRSGGGKDWSPD